MFENHMHYAWYDTLGVRLSEAQGAEWETQQNIPSTLGVRSPTTQTGRMATNMEQATRAKRERLMQSMPKTVESSAGASRAGGSGAASSSSGGAATPRLNGSEESARPWKWLLGDLMLQMVPMAQYRYQMSMCL